MASRPQHREEREPRDERAQAVFRARRVRRAHRQDPGRDGGARHRAADRHRPVEHGVAHGLRRLVVLRPPVRAAGAGRRAGLVWPRPGRQWREADDVPRRGRHRRLPRPLRAVDRAPSDGLPRRCGDQSRAAGAGGGSASRWTTTTSAPPVLPRCRSICRRRRWSTPRRWSTGSARSSRAQELEYMRRAARIVEAMHARILEVVEPGLPKNRLIAEIYHTGITRRRRPWRRLSGDRAAGAVGHRRLGRAPDLGRAAVPRGRRHLLRDRRLLPALPLPAVAHGLPRQAAAEVPRRRAGGARGDRGGARRGAARATAARTSRPPGGARSRATASRRRAAAATRSASATRRTGASAR